MQLEIEKCGCPNRRCYYQAGKQFSDEGETKTIKQIFQDTYATVNQTTTMIREIGKQRFN